MSTMALLNQSRSSIRAASTLRSLNRAHSLPMTRTTLQIPSRSISRQLYHSQVKPSINNTSTPTIIAATATLIAGLAIGLTTNNSHTSLDSSDDFNNTSTILNWSGTHAVHLPSARLWEPESIAEVESIVRSCHKQGLSVRPYGSALSPNGLSFQPKGMMSMANLDEVIKIDTAAMTVTVQAGARVSNVIEALRPYNMTLPTLASIAEQQMGGLVQVGAHGTGRTVAPIDHYVTSITLVTPNHGTITMTEASHGEEFHLAKVGLGLVGVVVEMTVKCIPAHKLREHTYVLTRGQARERIKALLKQHKHVRYMWLPYADAVVVVTNDPVDEASTGTTSSTQDGGSGDPHHSSSGSGASRNQGPPSSGSANDRFKPLHDLLWQVYKKEKGHKAVYTPELVKGMGFGELRDALLAVDPLNLEHVKKCNQAEAEFWKRSEGYQVKPSDELLQFDCGGQQWVYEVCFPTGTVDQNDGSDMDFMTRLLDSIESKGIPAHSPIEQRWSSSSSSPMSPAYDKNMTNKGYFRMPSSQSSEGLHSWVGIISYLPTDDERQRREITDAFTGTYVEMVRSIGEPFSATSHWAKLEVPKAIWQLADLRMFLDSRFPLQRFNRLRGKYDPKNILGNDLMSMAIGKPTA
jgi:L-galactono-1,4-lactone dehydrogenase